MVQTYIVNYDLKGIDKDYNSLYVYLKSRDSYKRLLDSCWAIRTSESIDQIMQKLKQRSDADDEFFVYKFPSNALYRDVFQKDIRQRSLWLFFRTFQRKLIRRRNKYFT